MRNEPIYKIPQDKLKEFLKLDNQKFQELKRAVGIATIEPLNSNNLKVMISYLAALGQMTPAINKLDLKSFEVDEKDINLIVEKTPEPKKIKTYKTKKQKVEKKTPIVNIKFFINHDEASKAYRLEKQTLYWSKTKEFVRTKMNKFDDSGIFSFNFKKIKEVYPAGKIYLFTDGTFYEQKTINSRKKIVYTIDQDKKILDYYNSDFYKYHKTTDGKASYTMKDLCKELKVKDRKLIAQRASELGFTDFVSPKAGNEYADEEIQIIEKNIGKATPKKIQQLLKEKGFQKSIVSINVKITRLNLSLKLDGTGDLTLTLLSRALGIDTHSITDNKKLMQQVNPDKTKKEWIFSREKVKEYILNNPYDLNFGKIDNKFLVELLTGEKE
jgi:hypothetical protein